MRISGTYIRDSQKRQKIMEILSNPKAMLLTRIFDRNLHFSAINSTPHKMGSVASEAADGEKAISRSVST